MVRYRSWWKSKFLAACAVALPLAAVEVPAGAELHLRLRSAVSSAASKPGQAVEAVVIAPVIVGGQFAIPAGALVRGAVREVKPATKPDERAVLGIDFSELEMAGKKMKLAARLAGVDNAREIIGDKGEILGILASETISARLDQGINKVARKYAGLADLLEAAKGTVLKAAEGEIAYGPGVELDVKTEQPLNVAAAAPPPKLEPIAAEGELIELVNRQPFQTKAEKPPKPSDLTNLMFVGTEEALRAVFQAAGWSPAAALSAQSKLETFRAIAELRGYKEAPMSILLLDGRPPDLVFEKQNNTFAQRHHLRTWRRPASFQDRPVWICAATHDIGIDFSQQDRTFIHKIDSQIDRERAKVVNDLLFTGRVRSLALVDRPDVPRDSQNATGDRLETDGRMVVLVLK